MINNITKQPEELRLPRLWKKDPEVQMRTFVDYILDYLHITT